MADTSKVIKEFHGDDEFPVDWENEAEKGLFWVYDDLHCPQPLSPMYEDIGGWWLSCDHMFRRFGTPFASDWIAKNVNGYLYTAAIPADPDFDVPAKEYGNLYVPRVPKDDPDYASKIGGYLNTVLPVYGANFVDWWRNRLVPEMERNLGYLESKIDNWEEISLAEWATILEDAMDIHDRHWKIHWMLNFAQLSATLRLQAVMEEVRGEADAELLGRLQNSADDRNWDSNKMMWEMKEEASEGRSRVVGGVLQRIRRENLRGSPGHRARSEVHRRVGDAVAARVRLACRVEPRVHLHEPVRRSRAAPRRGSGLHRE